MYHEYVTRRHALFLGATMMLGLCAMLTKEQGVTVFAVCMVYELVAHASWGPTTTLRVLLGMSHRKLSKTAEVSVIAKTDVILCLHSVGKYTGQQLRAGVTQLLRNCTNFFVLPFCCFNCKYH